MFLKELRKKAKKKFDAVPAGLRGRYLKDDGGNSSYDDARSSDGRRRIAVCARDVWRLVDRFRGDKAVAAFASYGLVKRLLDEQCELVEESPAPSKGDADANEPSVPVAPKAAKNVKSDSPQTPHDPSLTYSGHKGKGEEIQIAETCGNKDKPEMITYAEQTRSCDSDDSATVGAVDDLARRGIAPKEMLADTAYGSTANAIACEEKGAELVTPVAGPKVDEAKDDEIRKADFDVDPKGEKKTKCPAGREATSEKHDPETKYGTIRHAEPDLRAGRVRAIFGADTCAACPMRASCPALHGRAPAKPDASCPAKPLRDGQRVLRTTVHAVVLAKRRKYERTKEFRERYAERAGIEATNSELKRAHGLGRPRIRGVLRIRLAVYLKVLACNVKRMVKHLAGEAKKAAAAATTEGAAADGASRVIVRLLGRREVGGAAFVAAWRPRRTGRRDFFRTAAA